MSLPPAEVLTASAPTLGTPAILSSGSAKAFESGCLGCPDQPCVKFEGEELAIPARIDAPYSPDPAVCPTDAIGATTSGTVSVDPDACIGCGLCVVRCPVGAIYLDPNQVVAVVSRPGSNYVNATYSGGEFEHTRNAIATHVSGAPRQTAEVHFVVAQLRRMEPQLGAAALRLFVRNVFLILGAASRLQNQGDHNAVSEILVDSKDRLWIGEIEASGDVLDAARRLVSGVAIGRARYRRNPDELTPVLFLVRLPNERVDYYRIVRDVRDRLGVGIRTVPIAVLLLGLGSRDYGLVEFIESRCVVDDLRTGVTRAVAERYGQQLDGADAGVEPVK